MALSLLAFLMALHGYREYCARRTLPQIHHADFEAEVMHVGPHMHNLGFKVGMMNLRQSPPRTIFSIPV